MCIRILLASAFLVGLAARSNATHIIGGELYYDHLGGDQYQVSLKLYRDCGPGNVNGTQYDPTAMIGVFGGDGTLIFNQALPFPGATNVPVSLDDPCLTAPPSICVELAVFTGTFTLPPRADGYHLTYQRCCRTPTIINLPNAQDLGLTCTVRIPGSANGSNNAARFSEYPPIVLCLEEGLEFDHSASDADGDSLVYELCTPYNGGTAIDPIPTPTAPPYTEIPWSPGFSEAYPMDADPGIAIDGSTGLLTVRPTVSASYTVAIRVKEFREGMLLSETRRDFRFDVVPCQSEVSAVIAPQTIFCTGLTMDFSNVSPTGQTWWWDFGEANNDLDTSSVNSPSWTYASPGTYTINLIANPGFTCADTTSATFDVYVPPDPFFIAPGPVCGELTTELIAQGEFGTATSFLWQFGANATPPTATTSPAQVQFPSTGTHTVTLTAMENGCTGTYTEQLVANPVPSAFFTVGPPSPQPYGTDISFQDASDPNGATIVSWEWSANGGAIGTGTSFTWIDPIPGTYQLELTITSADGCVSTYTLPYVVTEIPIDIPNVFTPNRDGANEQFSILNIEQHRNQLKIFNRWGMPIYEAKNYQNQWTGMDVPDGTYYYELLLDDGRAYTGHLTLLR